jgi:heme oxygenase
MQRLSKTLIQLNLATREHHVAADAPWLELLVPTVTRRQYIEHLIKVYGFEAPLEAALRYTPGLSALVDLRSRLRSGLIVQDLMRLGLSAGRSAVRHYLTLHVSDLGNATSYLSAYDGVAGDRWSDLGNALQTVARAPPAQDQLVRAANHGFLALCEWFDGGTTLRSVGT